MRKTIATLILAGLLGAGCAQSPDSGFAMKAPDPGQPETTTGTMQTTGTMSKTGTMPRTDTMPKAAATERSRRPEKTYFPGGATDEGAVIVSSSQVYHESLGGSPGGKGYVNEKQSMNFQVAGSVQVREDRPAVADEVEFKAAIKSPLSTFSADVDTASFANIRREIHHGVLPSPHLVRVEEMLNYFQYDLPEPDDPEPFSVTTELSDCPWSDESKLMRVAIKTASIDRGDEPPRNLVFLLDVSGSMNSADKLPLLKNSLRKLVDTLDDSDRVAIVVYASSSGLVLPSTTGDQKTTILEAIDRLSAGGSTNGGEGIRLAYKVAEENRTDDSVNRVILATDGDFNVGLSSQSELKTFIEQKRDSGLFLSVLGFGRQSNDKIMETLADNGNGNYASIDTLNEARKVLVQEAGATLVTVAKDVKFQVAFDPSVVSKYRLIGYKNRRLAARDFNDDTKDAGELGAGHSVTALYEIQLNGFGPEQELLALTGLAQPATVKLRYKAPDADESTLMEVPVSGQIRKPGQSSADHQWACAVAGYGMLLTKELSTEQMPFERLASLMKPTMSSDPDAYQSEFYSMVKKTEGMALE
jgi:Ca-activated chloride channel family protein